MATIYEVAKKSGVSIGTVSRVLNDSPLTAVATRERVLQVIDELDYQPHAMAQGLARRKTNAIGVILPLHEGRSHAEILRGIHRALAQQNLDLILYGLDDLQKKDSFLRRALQQRRVDGIVLVALPLSGALAVDCKRRRLPLVLADSHHHQFDSITVDYRAGVRAAAEHLLQLGPRRFAVLASNEDTVLARQRVQDCRQALQEAGLAPVTINSRTPAGNAPAEAQAFAARDGYAVVKGLLAQEFDQHQRAAGGLALFITSEAQAAGALEAAREAGRRMPQEFALVSLDETVWRGQPGIVTLQPPKAEIGYQAVKRMLALLKNPALPAQHMALKPQLR